MRRECRMSPLQIPIRRHKEFRTPVKARALKPRSREIEVFIEPAPPPRFQATDSSYPHLPSAFQSSPCKISRSVPLRTEEFGGFAHGDSNWNLLNLPLENPPATPNFPDSSRGLLRNKSRFKSPPLAPIGEKSGAKQDMSVGDALFLYKEWKVFCESKLEDGLLDPWEACDRFLRATRDLLKSLESSKMAKIRTMRRLFTSLRSMFRNAMRTEGPLADAHNAIHSMLFDEERKRVATFAEAMKDDKGVFQISLPVLPPSSEETNYGHAQVVSTRKQHWLPTIAFMVRSPEETPRASRLLIAPVSPASSSSPQHRAEEAKARRGDGGGKTHRAEGEDVHGITDFVAAINNETAVSLTTQAPGTKSTSPRTKSQLPPPVPKVKGIKPWRVCPVDLPWWSKLYYIPQRRHELPAPSNSTTQTSFSNAIRTKTNFSRSDDWLSGKEQSQKGLNQTATGSFDNTRRSETNFSRDDDWLSVKEELPQKGLNQTATGSFATRRSKPNFSRDDDWLSVKKELSQKGLNQTATGSFATRRSKTNFSRDDDRLPVDEQSETGSVDIARTASMMSRNRSCHMIEKVPQFPIADNSVVELDSFPPSVTQFNFARPYLDDLATPTTGGDESTGELTQTIMSELDDIFKDMQRKGVRSTFRDRPMTLVSPLQILDAKTSGTIKEGATSTS